MTVLTCSKAGVVGSNPTRGMNVRLRLLCVYIVLWVGSGLATGWSPSKESYRLCMGLRNWKIGQGPTKGCRSIERFETNIAFLNLRVTTLNHALKFIERYCASKIISCMLCSKGHLTLPRFYFLFRSVCGLITTLLISEAAQTGTVLTCLVILSWPLFGRTECNHENLRLTGFETEIWTRNHHNTRQEW
jgi:hypothetical protein